MMHKVYLRLPPLAKLAADQEQGSVAIECGATELPELCKWLRLTADSLDGKLSASELGHLQEVLEQQVNARILLSAIEACQRYAQEHPEHSRAATEIGIRIAEGADR